RLLPSRRMMFQNYAMIIIIGAPIYALHRVAAWAIAGYYLYAGIWGFFFCVFCYALVANWREDATVVEPLLIKERVSKSLLPIGIALFLLSRVLGLYVAI